MERASFDRNIRVEVFQILQLEIEGRKGATGGQYLMLKVLEKFDVIRVRTNKIRMKPMYERCSTFTISKRMGSPSLSSIRR
jgi:hypothetical protein